MDEVDGFCVRMLGPGEGAAEAARGARATGKRDRLAVLGAAASECRQREQTPPGGDSGDSAPVRPSDPESVEEARGADPSTEDPEGPTEPDGDDDPRREDVGPPSAEPTTLAEGVGGELARATAGLPERQREALALTELLALPHEEVGRVIGIDAAAVAPLLARARLGLRLRLRGEGPPAPECPERDRALRTIALRQDGEQVAVADDDWLVEHLGHCEGCARAHAAMLEASACYRAWRLPETEAEPAPAPA